MSKESRKADRELANLNRRYFERFGEIWPSIGRAQSTHKQWIERCLRLDLPQEELDIAQGLPPDAII